MEFVNQTSQRALGVFLDVEVLEVDDEALRDPLLRLPALHDGAQRGRNGKRPQVKLSEITGPNRSDKGGGLMGA
jgi:hypothetical protein